MKTSFRFELLAEDPSGARRGRLTTPHGTVETPAFMPVGTQGTVKAMTRGELLRLDAEMILCNAYHLYLRPGAELVARAGGLHGFINWPRPILTDSGGYQIFSLESMRRVSEEGVTFRSHLDGSEHMLSPEKAIEVQQQLGADVIMCFDQPVPYPSEHAMVVEATDRSDRWAERCRQVHPTGGPQALFGIIQGGVNAELRRRSTECLLEIGFEGYALGGLSVGEPRAKMLEMTQLCTELLPREKPRYLMGVGTPADLVQSVACGVDLFDCVLPTRLGRNGAVFVTGGRLNMKNAQYEDDFSPLDPKCDCSACRHHTRAYLRHLYKAGEILAARIATYHNLHHYFKLMATMRRQIEAGSFRDFLSSAVSD